MKTGAKETILVSTRLQNEDPPAGAWNYSAYDNWHEVCPKYAVIYGDEAMTIGTIRQESRGDPWYIVMYPSGDPNRKMIRDSVNGHGFKSFEVARKRLCEFTCVGEV